MKKLVIGMFAVALLMGAAKAADVYHLLTGHALSATTTSQVHSTAFNNGTRVIRVVAENDAFVAAAATNPFASSTGFFVVGDVPLFMSVQGGDFLAYRASDTSGMIYVQELTR